MDSGSYGITRGTVAASFVSSGSQFTSARRAMHRITLLAGSALAGLLPVAASAQQLIQNSSFEAVSSPGSTANTFCTAAFWTTVGTCNADYQYNTAANIVPASGNLSINLTVQNSVSLSQAVNVTTPGNYSFAFQYILVGGSHSATASVGTNTFLLTTSQASWAGFSSTVTLANGITNVTFASAPSGIANFALDDVTLTLLRAVSLFSILPANAPTNSSNVVRTLDSATNSQGVLPGTFNNLLTFNGQQLQSAASQMSGEPGADVAQSSTVATSQFLNTMFDAAFDDAPSAGLGANHVPANQSGGNGALGYAASGKAKTASDAFAAMAPGRVAQAYEPHWTSWGSVYGGDNRISGNAAVGSSQTNSRVWGVVGGADYKLSPDTRFGFALGGGGSSFGVDNGLGGGKSDMIQIGAYARHDVGAAYLAGAVAYAWQNVTTDRTIAVAGLDTLHASFNAHAWAGRIESGWRVATPVVGITPYAALQAIVLDLPGYSERATAGTGAFALNYAAHSVTATRSELGVRWDKTWLVGDETAFFVKARTAWAHNWNNDRSAVATFQSLPGVSAFTVNGASPDADSALLSLGAGVTFHRGWSLTATYEGENARNAVSNSGRGTLKYEW